MAIVRDIDETLQRLGKAAIGASARSSDPALAPVFEEIRRGMLAMEAAVRLLAQHARQGPEWGVGPTREIHVRWNAVNASRRFSARHKLPAAPDRFVVVLTSSELAAGTATTFGGITLVSSSSDEVVFEIDADAVTSKTSFLVLVWVQAGLPVGAATSSRDLVKLQTAKPAGYIDPSNMNG